MPLPVPSKGELQGKFISRCIGTLAGMNEFPDARQRAAVCYSQWRKKHPGNAPAGRSLTFGPLLDRIERMAKEIVRFKPFKVSLVGEPATGIPFYVTKQQEASMGALAELFPLSEEDAASLKEETPDKAKEALAAAVESLKKWKDDFPPELAKVFAVLVHASRRTGSSEEKPSEEEPPKKPVGDKTPPTDEGAGEEPPPKKPAAATSGGDQEQAAGEGVTLEGIRQIIGEAMREVVEELKGG